VGGVEASAARTNNGTATLSATRTSAGGITTHDYLVTYDGSAWRVQRADTGAPVAYTGTTTLDFDGISVSVGGTAVAGDRFLVRPAAGAINGLGVLISDPARIAAAAPIRTATGTANTGNGVISAGEVLDADNAALRDSVSIQFTGPGTWEARGAGNVLLASGSYSSGGNIDVNGWRVNITGTPATGDSFTVSSNSSGVGDNRNALALAGVMHKGVLAGGTESLDGAVGRFVGAVGVAAAGANASLEAQQIIYDDSMASIDALSGVNLDEEAANMLRYQQAYQAAAQMIRVTQELMDTLMNAVNR
jgi:flagellar hook-associated protein 1 FlgK